MEKNRYTFIFLLIVLSHFFSCSAFSKKDKADDNVISVTVKELGQLVFHPVKKAPAEVVTLQNSLLSSEISALVTDIEIQIGEHVAKGQLLLSLECDDYELNKQHLLSEKKAKEAERNFASYQYERSKKLIKSKSVSEQAHRRQAMEVSKLSAQIQLLHSRIQQAEKSISRCQIRAPFSGVIAERLIYIGEHVAPHTPLLRLIDIDNLEVEVQVPIVVVDDLDYSALNFVYRNQRYPLKLRAVIPSIETRARHQRVRLRFVGKKTLPNAYGIVEITLRANHIPANYLVTRNSRTGFFLVHKNTDKIFEARFYAIKDAMTGRTAVVDFPLDSLVIISGRNALTDGQRVVINE